MSNAVANSLVYQHLKKVSPNLASEFEQHHDCSIKLNSNLAIFNHQFQSSRCRPKINDGYLINKRAKLTPEQHQANLVYRHLLRVTPEIATEFQQKQLVTSPIETTLEELVDKFNKDNGPIIKKGKESIPCEGVKKMSLTNAIPVITLSDEDTIDASGEDTVEISSSSQSSSSDEDSETNNVKELIERRECEQATSLLCSESQSKQDKIEGITTSNEVDQIPKMNQLNVSVPSVDLPTDDQQNISTHQEYRHISRSSVYSELRKDTKEDSIVDKIVVHILDEDIKISQVNFDHIITSSDPKRGAGAAPDTVQLGSFSPLEDRTIISNWNKLVTELNISNPEETFKKLCKRPTKEQKLKTNVIGLYLSQGLQKLRLAADVFRHAEKKLINFVRGKYSRCEHDFIMDYVSRHGESYDVFKYIAKHLNRFYPKAIRNYYFKHSRNLHKKGPYTSLENQIFIADVIQKSKIKTVLDIKNYYSKEGTVKKATFIEIAEKIGRPVPNVVIHWEQRLKPLLLQYHAGTVHFDIKTILVNFLLDKNIVYLQDIPWNELLAIPQFAGHTKMSLERTFNDVLRRTQRKYQCKREEVTIAQVAQFINGKLNLKTNKKLVSQKQDLLDYYSSLIEMK